MDSTQKLVIALLAIAIVFSVISIAMNMTLGDFKKIQVQAPRAQVVSGIPRGNEGGAITLKIDGAGPANG